MSRARDGAVLKASAEASSFRQQARRLRDERILQLAREGELSAADIARRLGCAQSTAPVVTLEWIDADIHRGFLGCQRCAGERLVDSPSVPEWEAFIEAFEAAHLFCARAP